LADLLEPVLAEVLPQLLQPQRQALEVALLRAEGRADPRAVSAAVLSVLRILAAVAPVLIAVDDVQWLDSSTARALEFSLRRLEAEPVRILVSGRTQPLPVGLEDAQVVGVGPLAADAIAQLIRRRLGRSLARPTLMRLHRACGGNPFFALEIAKN